MNDKISNPPKPPTPPPSRYVRDFGMPDWYCWLMLILIMSIVFMPVIRKILDF